MTAKRRHYHEKESLGFKKTDALFGYRLVAGHVHFHVNTHEAQSEACHD